jgi:carbonic anhydrase
LIEEDHGKFDAFAFSANPFYDEAVTREAFSHAVPLKTLVIYCYDPRAVKIPDAVAKRLGGQVYPGEIVRDAAGKRTASTTIFPVVVAGGRAVDALRSITVAQHLFGIENIVFVHHSWCGATSFTADGIIGAWRREQGADISNLYDRGSICIEDYEASTSTTSTLAPSRKWRGTGAKDRGGQRKPGDGALI